MQPPLRTLISRTRPKLSQGVDLILTSSLEAPCVPPILHLGLRFPQHCSWAPVSPLTTPQTPLGEKQSLPSWGWGAWGAAEGRGHKQGCAGNHSQPTVSHCHVWVLLVPGCYQASRHQWQSTHASSFQCAPRSSAVCAHGSFRASCPECSYSEWYIPTHFWQLLNFRVDSVALGNVLLCISSWF